MTGSKYNIKLNGSYFLPIPNESTLSSEEFIFVYPNVKIKGVVLCDKIQYEKITSQIKTVTGGNPQLTEAFTSILAGAFKAQVMHSDDIAYINIEPVGEFDIINRFDDKSELLLSTFDDPLLKGYAELTAV